MGNDKKSIEVLSISLEMEKKGYDFYMKAANKSTNELGKKTFAALAEDEKRHAEAIEKYQESISGGKASPQLKTAVASHKNIKERLLFGKSEAERLKDLSVDADELKAYDVAMQLEKDGRDYYKKALESLEDEKVKDLYKFLISEEEAHFDIIFRTAEYLKDPGGWFAKEEGHFFEG
ncbi:MAG: ferritin family protein [Candidatus Omnitrophica bacterium]|nr:ferritin family protein [Candidatus Omnitrophota bacterium]